MAKQTIFQRVEMVHSAESEANYRREWKEIIDLLYSNPCEGYGYPSTNAGDNSKLPISQPGQKLMIRGRLVNPASGGNHYTCGRYSRPAQLSGARFISLRSDAGNRIRENTAASDW